jgi:hypothetical protein
MVRVCAVGVADMVHVEAGVGVAVGVRHSNNALVTPSIAQLMETPPAHTNAEQASIGAMPSRMLTPVISSLTRTMPSPSQSPVQVCAAAMWPRSVVVSAIEATAEARRRIAIHSPHPILAQPAS